MKEYCFICWNARGGESGEEELGMEQIGGINVDYQNNETVA